MSQYAIRFKEPKISPLLWISGKNIKPVGYLIVFSKAEEAIIARTLGVVVKWRFSLTKMDIRDVVKEYLDKQREQVRVFKDRSKFSRILHSSEQLLHLQ